ncbi:cytochrome c [Reichenbachiella ulvae]|uniref:Cytochrome c n=1 Tax=Reichenbachiella ulvae TaxID=2980104 RepID=A0ABT3CPQ8_9BACT|nr:cytochrome c [Reichenbachiella ulvae]MCV9385671.1 cytochrome c [Reichenbachiella ulvae]
MKKNLLQLFAGMAMCSVLFSCASQNQTKEESAAPEPEISQESVIERGAYLVETMGCNDCHSPKQMGPKGPEIIPELMLSGYPSDRPIMKVQHEMIAQGFSMFYPDLTAAIGPWGMTFAANLTPDASGLGNWSEEQFAKALKEGKYKGLDGSRMLLPPMPWTNYVNLKDEDVSAIFAYLKSIPAVSNVVPAPIAPGDM